MARFCTSVKFLVHSQGIRPDPDKIEAVVQFATPTSAGEVHRFLGIVNQLNKFPPNLADHTQPLRELLGKDRTWVWADTQRQPFEKVKQMLVASPVLAMFNPNLRQSSPQTHHNKSYGLGAVLTGHGKATARWPTFPGP
jgi:hypothetical protein